MGKNQDARKRKVSSRNGSSGRGNGADTAKLNGKTKQKTIDETPGWQKTLGALVVIAAVLAAAFFTGVIRIDRNIDTDEVQDPTQEAHSTVADIKESKNNKTTSKFTETEPNINQASQETLTESELKDKQDKDEANKSAKDAKVEDNVAKVESKTNPKEQAAPPQRSQETSADVPPEANVTKKTKDKLDIPEEAVHEEKKVKESDGPKEDKAKAQPQEHSSKDKKKTGKEGIARPPPPSQETIQPEEKRTVQEQAPPPQRSQESNADVPAEAKATKKTKDKLDIPEETIHEGKKVKDSGPKEDKAKAQTQEHSSKDKKKTGKEGIARPPPPSQETIQPEEKRSVQEQDAPPQRSQESKKKTDKVDKSPEDEQKEEVLKKGREETVEPVPTQGAGDIGDSAKRSSGKEATVTETDSPKGKMVTPKRTPKNDEKLKEPKSKQTQANPPPQEQVAGKPEDHVDTKPKEPSEEKDKKVVKTQANAPPQEQEAGKPEDHTETKPKEPSEQKDKKVVKTQANRPPQEQVAVKPEDLAETKPKEPSEEKDKKVVLTRANAPPQEQVAVKPENHAETKPIKESLPKPPMSKDGPSKKVVQDPKDTSPQPPSIDTTKDSPPKTIKSKVDPELPPADPPSSPQSSRSKDNTVAKATDDADGSRGGRDEAAADHVGDASKTKERMSSKTESKKQVTKKSALDTLLEEAEGLIQKNKKDQALYKYEDIIKRFPDSAKVLMAKAKLLDGLAEERRSNDLLDGAILSYRQAADAPNCPRDIHRAALARMADRLSFFGKSAKSIQVYQELVKEHPDDNESKKNLAVQYLIVGKNNRAKHYFEQMLESNPTDGFAQVHLGFILKAEANYLEAIPLLRAGINSGDRETNEGKYFFHLGESYLRIGQVDESYKVYDEGVSRGHFRSRYQRSLYNVDLLRGKEFWTPKGARYADAAKKLESNWETIRDEALALLSSDGLFQKEEEKLQDTGDWKQFTLYAKGNKNQANCQQAPRTCEIIDTIPESRGCRRGQVKFSVMHPGTHVWPHCGPTNCRLRGHLGLVIPQPVRLRVGNITRTWEEGKFFIFDDSFEHEVWQEADRMRVILIVDLWHPDLTESDRNRLTAI
ncbi:aspartyl/asparaginyl beta-hydroxylase isoform X2 [Strongylocentrotus purpuratus]|uniref:Aspartyl/asparaginy/proline hydroxylase domain-containing protein n=1 Tax=Strongylocentrotus purpuratus TaxID=7668 RepID=A0A7M7N2K6_STRPU|nr:aspartyl/asparaginyl beta-hydroxylase isoform X2 [Strongylocentrotus purpuratus]